MTDTVVVTQVVTETVDVITAGPTGATGAQGIQGDQGIQGIQGVAGADGKTVLNGTGVPSAGLGVDGDFFIDTAADDIYGPKTAGVWGSATSLIGPTGAAGATGAGVAAGGTAGQVLEKIDATDFNTQWADPAAGGGGAWVLDSTQTLVAATAVDLDLSAGRFWRILLVDIDASVANFQMGLRFSTDGATFNNTADPTGTINTSSRDAPTIVSIGNDGSSFYPIIPSSGLSRFQTSRLGSIEMFVNRHTTGFDFNFESHGHISTSPSFSWGAASSEISGDYTHFRFLPPSGNFNGKLFLYKLADA